MISNSDRKIEEIAIELVRLSNISDGYRQAPDTLSCLRDLELYCDYPEIGEKLTAALERNGGSSLTPWYLPLAQMGLVPLAVMRQRAVGHGGFHSGALGRSTARLRWVYDCGASREAGITRLESEIAILKGDGEKRTLDLLFLSHFDRDHVSGVGKLLEALNVKTVIMPYLDDLQQLAILFEQHVLEDGQGTVGDLEELLADPIRWFRARGVAQVIQIKPARPGTRPGIAEFEVGTEIEVPKGTGAIDLIFVNDRGMPATLPPASAVVATGCAWVATHQLRRAGDWCLLPYVTSATVEAQNALRRAVTELLGDDRQSGRLIERFQRKVGEAGFFQRVKQAYRDAHLGDANAVSMSLYVGPFRDAVWYSRRMLNARRKHHMAGPGWLLTGDAKLDQVSRRKEWLEFYKSVRGHVGALMLPHHGSAAGFHENILEAARPDALVFACKHVADVARPLGDKVLPYVSDRLHMVTDDDESTLIQVSGAPVLDAATLELESIVTEWA